MKLTITREDLRQFVLQETNIDIGQTPIDIEIEGYFRCLSTGDVIAKSDPIMKTARFINENSIYGVSPDLPRRTTTVDKNGFVTGIKDEKPKASINNKKWSDNLKGKPDYTDYENTVLDFATSNEHKRQVPFFGAGTISCVKERYRKIIKKLGVSDSVKFSRINNLPYLVKIEGTTDMAEELKKGINAANN